MEVEGEYLSADIACLILGNNTYITYDEMNTFYRVTKDYIIDNQLKDDDTVSVDFHYHRYIRRIKKFYHLLKFTLYKIM